MAESLAVSPFPNHECLPVTNDSFLPNTGGLLDTSEPYDGLPPDDMWVVAKQDCRSAIETPLDDRGLIDTDALIVACKSLIRPEYRWPSGTSRHHIYWTEQMFRDYTESHPGSVAVPFRGLPINIGLVPRQFENVLHYATRQTPVPEESVMRWRIEAWRVAHNLFTNARNVVRLERLAQKREVSLARHPDILRPEFDGEDLIGREIMAEIFSRHFRGIHRHFEDQQNSVPSEFWVVSPENPLAEIAVRIGAIIGKRSVPLVRKVLVA